MKKNTILIIIVIAVAALTYFYFNSGSSGGGVIEEQNNPEVEMAANRVLALLNQINSIKIDTDIFESTSYQTLRDISIPIPVQPVGRQNPFAPLPGESSSPNAATRNNRR